MTNKIWWGKNGTWFASGDPAIGTNAAYTNLPASTFYPAFSSFDIGGPPCVVTVNFGENGFTYTQPTGSVFGGNNGTHNYKRNRKSI